MAAKIKQALDSEPELIGGEAGIFDVVVGDKLVYSKFETGSFPDEDRLVHELLSSYGGK